LASFHLLDAGEGMSHVLPVLVAASLTARGHGHRMLAVEEPESHLHGDTQRSLVRFLAELAARPDPPILLLETHSRAMLLGLQLAVAERVLPVEAAQVLWCEQDERGESHLHRVEIMPDGGLRGWPRAALASEAEMVRDLLELQARSEVK
jgi:predicted ATPase